MQTIKRISVLMILAGLMTLAHTKVFSYAYNPWTTMTGDKTFVVNPFLKAVDFKGKYYAIDPVLLYGVTATFDIIANPGSFTFIDGTNKYASSWILPRYDLGGNNILGLQIGYDETGYFSGVTKTAFITPQYNYVFENDSLAVEVNAGFIIPFEDTKSTTFAGILAPVFKASPGKIHLFVEADPYYFFSDALTDKFVLNLLPGIWFGFNEGKYQISLAAMINNVTGANDADPTYGAAVWFWVAF